MRYRRACIFDLRLLLRMEAVITHRIRVRRTPRRIQGRVPDDSGSVGGSARLVLRSHANDVERPEPRGTRDDRQE
jgi:hypothetical protein